MEQVIYKDRKNTDCAKWDGLKEKFGQDDLLAMWVADMDFEVPVCVKKALQKYVEEGVYGYYQVPDSYYEAFMNWEKTNHDYEVKKEWIRFSPGVVPAINWLIQILTKKDDSILIMPPVYHPFREGILANERRKIDCPLWIDNGIYKMDVENFKKKIVEEDVKLFILCSPHNPVGRVWTEEELRAVLEICKKYQVYVIADEIHQDIVTGERKKVTAATVGKYDEILVTLTAATKTFNLAGCSNSFVIIPSEKIRAQYDEFLNSMHMLSGNTFGYIAVQAAYEGGREWLDKVRTIIKGNYERMKELFSEKLPEAIVYPMEGTYLAWIDLGAYIKKEDMKEIVQNKAKIAVDFGDWFGGEEYASFIRLNLATRLENVEETVNRLEAALK